VSEVRRAIVGGFLPVRRRGRELMVTAGALTRFLVEERADAELVRRRHARIATGKAKLIPLADVCLATSPA